MYFLGAASNYSASDTFRHLFAFGTEKDSFKLRQFLAHHYKTDIGHVALLSNGRSALSVALKIAIPKDSKIVINGFTCKAVVEAVKSAGDIPIYADINPDFLHYDAKILTELIKKHPDIKAIIIQNTLGNPVDIAEIEKVTNKHNIAIIEDLAHCTGVFYPDGREAGTVGIAAALSFGKGKSIDTITGGAVVLNKNLPKMEARKNPPKLSSTLRARWYPIFGAIGRFLTPVHLSKYWFGCLIKIHFIERSADSAIDSSVRLTHWQAKLALKQLKNLPKNGRPPIRQHYFVKNREELLEKLAKSGFYFSEIWYDTPISPARYYKNIHFPEKECPNSVSAAKEIINLPTHYEESKLQPAIKIIEEYLK